MRKEIFIATISALLGGAVAIGVEFMKTKLFPPDNQLSQNVAELSVFSKELVLEQKALSANLQKLASKTQGNVDIDIEITNITNRINNIIATVTAYENKARDVSILASGAEKNISKAKFIASADVASGTRCYRLWRANTLAVIDRSGQMYHSLNGSIGLLVPGQELRFTSPAGKSMVSYLGKSGDLYQFRLVCGNAL